MSRTPILEMKIELESFKKFRDELIAEMDSSPKYSEAYKNDTLHMLNLHLARIENKYHERAATLMNMILLAQNCYIQ